VLPRRQTGAGSRIPPWPAPFGQPAICRVARFGCAVIGAPA